MVRQCFVHVGGAHRSRAFTLIELLVIVVVVAGLTCLLLPKMSSRCRCGPGFKDKTQIVMIHKSMLTFASDNNSQMPVPGQIRTRDDGTEDFSQNTSANLYSMLIAQNFFNPDLCIGTTEVNPRIVVKHDYNYNAYKPAQGLFGDQTFAANPATGSNTSYAHSALVGARKVGNWRNTASSGFAAIGTRGTGGGPNGFGGALAGREYDKSPTLELHGPMNQWDGHICFNDNHVERLNTFFSALCTYVPRGATTAVKDNFFAAEFSDFATGPQASADSWLVLCTSVEPVHGNSCSPVWDPLNP